MKNLTPREQKLWEYIESLAAKAVADQLDKQQAIIDYNEMMGELKNPKENDNA